MTRPSQLEPTFKSLLPLLKSALINPVGKNKSDGDAEDPDSPPPSYDSLPEVLKTAKEETEEEEVPPPDYETLYP